MDKVSGSFKYSCFKEWFEAQQKEFRFDRDMTHFLHLSEASLQMGFNAGREQIVGTIECASCKRPTRILEAGVDHICDACEDTRLRHLRAYWESGCECLLSGRLPMSVACDSIAVEYYERNCKCSRRYHTIQDVCICVTNINDFDLDTDEKKHCDICNDTGTVILKG
jgi:hypothetical protein